MGMESRWQLPAIQRVREWLLNPRINEQRLGEALNTATERQPPPVIWLLGKAQSGKTSVIRALTGSSRAEIGNGFQACTATASFYDFPQEAPSFASWIPGGLAKSTMIRGGPCLLRIPGASGDAGHEGVGSGPAGRDPGAEIRSSPSSRVARGGPAQLSA